MASNARPARGDHALEGSTSARRRRALWGRSLRLAVAVLIGTVVAGAAAGLGVVRTMSQSFEARAAIDLPAQPENQAGAGDDRVQVAVALGMGGSVVADALAPYGVFAKSERFNVFTVASDRVPVGLSGGLTAVPDYSVADVRTGRAPRPDIIVIPAFADPAGDANGPVRAWIKDAAKSGTTILGVCAGARVLAVAGVLDGKTATSHFAELPDLERSHPATTWVRGVRYVDDGQVTTTAGVTSGIVGSLHLLERFAGRSEAERVGQLVGASEWQISDGTTIPIHTQGPEDYPYLLGAALPWFRPTWGVAIGRGSDEIDIAAAFEVYSGSSFAVELLPIAPSAMVETAHGLHLVATTMGDSLPRMDRLIIPGEADREVAPVVTWARAKSIPVFTANGASAHESSFAPLLRDLARSTDAATAVTLAKYIEYPSGEYRAASAVPGRLLSVLAGVLLVGISTGVLTWILLSRWPGSSAFRRARLRESIQAASSTAAEARRA